MPPFELVPRGGEVTAGPGGGRPAVAHFLALRDEVVTGLQFDRLRPGVAGTAGPVTCAENSVTSCGLQVFVHEAAEPISSQWHIGRCGGRGSAACGRLSPPTPAIGQRASNSNDLPTRRGLRGERPPHVR